MLNTGDITAGDFLKLSIVTIYLGGGGDSTNLVTLCILITYSDPAREV